MECAGIVLSNWKTVLAYHWVRCIALPIADCVPQYPILSSGFLFDLHSSSMHAAPRSLELFLTPIRLRTHEAQTADNFHPQARRY